MKLTKKKAKLTKKKTLGLHAELWMWLALNPDKDKDDWPEWKKNGGKISNIIPDCFCCEYVSRYMGGNCLYCPIVWGNNKSFCCTDGEFKDWNKEKCPQKRSLLAFKIASLPERK